MSRISYRFLVPGWSAKPLVSAHDRIMGTHTQQSTALGQQDTPERPTVTHRRSQRAPALLPASLKLQSAPVTDPKTGQTPVARPKTCPDEAIWETSEPKRRFRANPPTAGS